MKHITKTFMGVLYIISFFAITLVICVDIAGADALASGAPSPSSLARAWMRCYTTPLTSSSSTTSLTSTSTSTSTNYGFVFGLETNNANVLSVDTYLLTTDGRRVKQVGHAEALSNKSSTSSGAGLNIQNTSDSPMAFTFASSSSNTTGKFSASVTDTLFTGQTLTSMAVTCKSFVENQSQSQTQQ